MTRVRAAVVLATAAAGVMAALAWPAAFALPKAFAASLHELNPIVIQPYGALSALLTKDSPWRVFRSDDPVLTSIRADRLLFTKGEDCKMWVRSLTEDRRGIEPLDLSATGTAAGMAAGMAAGTATGMDSQWPALAGWKGWLPIEGKELDAIEDCGSFPCAVKMDEAEASRMKKSPESARLATFLGIVADRAREYLKSGKRSPYEFTGGISEPWSVFEARGLKSDLARPASAELGLRILDFHESRVRPIRQLLDRRVAVSKDGMQASVWVRDVYTDHYFDSWGEWANLRCFPEKHYVEVVFAMSLELDLLKEHDLISRLARPSMRNSVRELTIQYLDGWSHGVQSLTEEQARKSGAGPR